MADDFESSPQHGPADSGPAAPAGSLLCEAAAGGFMRPTTFREQFTDIADACALAQSIVDTVREPIIVLDNKLRVVAASRSFYSVFKVSPEDTQGKLLYALGDGQWDIPKLRVLLEKIIPEHGVMEDYEVEHDFLGLGHRTMCLNARQVIFHGGADATILLGMEDITARLILERRKTSCCNRKAYCSTKFSTELPTACRSSQASSC
jgi:PAS domain-containing protein